MSRSTHTMPLCLPAVQHVDLAAHVKDTYGYELDAYGRDVAAIFCIGILVRIIACAVMIVIDREKKV